MQPLFCGIDFGTSNTTVGVTDISEAKLLPLEQAHRTLPTAIFFGFSDQSVSIGRAAVEQYLQGNEGRYMQSLKSILGTSLIHEKTRIRSRSVSFSDILGHFFAILKSRTEHLIGRELTEVVLGRPVRFVDSDDAADAAAQHALETIVRAQGFQNVAFQYEPIAAALDYEQRVTREELVLIIDIGGGTSDFSIVRVSPERSKRSLRRDDIIATGGIHIGGTDFDRLLSLSSVMPQLGYGTRTTDGKRQLPVHYFHDLATWHRIHSLYKRAILHDLRQMRYESERRDLVDQLIRVIEEQRGHSLALAVERGKIELTSKTDAVIDMEGFQGWTPALVLRTIFEEAIGESVDRVVRTVLDLMQRASLKPNNIDTVFVTGGSSLVPLLHKGILSQFPDARLVSGDLLGSVGIGLSIDARRRFGS